MCRRVALRCSVTIAVSDSAAEHKQVTVAVRRFGSFDAGLSNSLSSAAWPTWPGT